MTAKTLPQRIAAAAALYEPGPLLRVEAAEDDDDRGDDSRGALLLMGAVALALLWANLGPGYAAFWHTRIALTAGPWTLGADVRTWIDEGLMTLFFLVVGLEAKRERDLGALRDGRRIAVPVAAGPGAGRLRVFLLTLLVVDDVVALLVISLVYPGRIVPAALVVAAGLLAPALSAVALRRGSLRPVVTPC